MTQVTENKPTARQATFPIGYTAGFIKQESSDYSYFEGYSGRVNTRYLQATSMKKAMEYLALLHTKRENKPYAGEKPDSRGIVEVRIQADYIPYSPEQAKDLFEADKAREKIKELPETQQDALSDQVKNLPSMRKDFSNVSTEGSFSDAEFCVVELDQGQIAKFQLSDNHYATPEELLLSTCKPCRLPLNEALNKLSKENTGREYGIAKIAIITSDFIPESEYDVLLQRDNNLRLTDNLSKAIDALDPDTVEFLRKFNPDRKSLN